jgi:predicted Fe-Mo cluster-binding NifX family protein
MVMTVALALFKDVVAPRLDKADKVFIYEIAKGEIKNREVFDLFFDHTSYLHSILEQKKVEKVLCGSCPETLLRILRYRGIDVICNLLGDPQNNIEMFLSKMKQKKGKGKNPESFGQTSSRRKK